MTRADSPLSWHALCVPKQGHSADEYEDAWAADPAAGRFAVADGASESSFAALWARLLAEGFVAARRQSDLTGWLADPRRRWAAEVNGRELPWYAEMKREQGAFATLLGLRLRPPAATRPGAWRAQAVGDSCVVSVRADGRLQSFPLTNSGEFGNQPRLIGSREGSPLRQEFAAGPLLPGDYLFLMTDALAQWFLHTHERAGRPWLDLADVLSSASPAEAFAGWIDGLRKSGALRNDDVTLLAIRIEARVARRAEREEKTPR
jgi:hypothetical protein